MYNAAKAPPQRMIAPLLGSLLVIADLYVYGTPHSPPESAWLPFTRAAPFASFSWLPAAQHTQICCLDMPAPCVSCVLQSAAAASPLCQQAHAVCAYKDTGVQAAKIQPACAKRCNAAARLPRDPHLEWACTIAGVSAGTSDERLQHLQYVLC
jgi:hypothetical protein